MQPIAMIRSGMIRPLYDWIDRNGMAQTPTLRDARRLIADPTSLVPAALAGSIFAAAERAAGAPAFGLLVGAATPLLETGDWGAVLSRAPCVGAAVDAAIRSARRFNTGQRLWAVRRGDEVWIHHKLAACVATGRAAAHEYALMLILQVIRLGAGPGWRPAEIHLEAPRPPHAERIEALATTRVVYEQPYTAVVFPVSVLAAPYPERLRHAPAVADARVPADDFAQSARQLVDALLDLGAADLPTAAEALRLSERTLQRRLTAAGASFTDLVEDVRCEKARRMLREGSAKIVEISAELGYADSANFTRAFRRWTGMAPQAFRRRAATATAAGY